MNLLTKRLTFFFASAAATVIATAAPVTPQQAREAIGNFKNSNPNLRKAPASGSLQLAYTQTGPEGNCFYIFNSPNDSGFTIASADDRLPTVIGFSENGNFDMETANPNLVYWLGEYEKEINGFLKRNPEIAAPTAKSRPVDYPVIDPLCTTKWNQDKPYNNDCPYDSRYHATSVTGCVATAMAQVMKYHNWPEQPTGSRNGYIFSSSKLDWANMLDEYVQGQYNSTQANAVAKLMRMCGASVDMMYSAYASGAYENDVQVALRTYFDYDPNLQLQYRDYFTYTQWSDMVYNEISTNGPVFYCGQSNAGGHAFVCDGYLGNNYYHFNWGWGGYQDGYFLLNALNPATGGAGSSAGGYNANQSILIGVKKNQNSGTTHLQELAIATGSFSWTNNKFSITQDPYGDNLIYNPLAYTITANFGVKVAPMSGSGDVRYVAGSSRTLSRWNGFSDMTVTMPTMPDGSYMVSPAMKTSWGEWQDVGVPYGFQRYVTMEVKNGKTTYINAGAPADEKPQLVAGEPLHISNVYAFTGSAYRVTITNIGKGDFLGTVYFSLEDSEDEFGYAVSDKKWMLIPAQFSLDVDFVSDEPLSEGKYVLEIFDSTYNLLYSGTIVNVKESEYEEFDAPNVYVEDFEPRFYTKNSDGIGMVLKAVNGTAKDVTQTLNFTIVNESTLEPVMNFSASGIELDKSSSRLVNFANMPLDLPAGGYYVYIKNPAGDFMCPPVPLSILSETKQEGGIYYTVTSDSQKTAMVLPPPVSDYSGNVVVPATVNGGYTVNNLKANAFTFASEMPSVTLPASITVIGNGTFYYADGLEQIHCQSETPVMVRDYAFGPYISEKTVLYTPANTANFYAQEENWLNFLISNWTINAGAGVTITNGLLVNPDTSEFYSPYYISGNESLGFQVSVPAGKYVNASWQTASGKTGNKDFDGAVTLPALYGESATVNLSVVDELGVNSLLGNEGHADVYGIDGILVKRNASEAELNQLPKGIYIVNGRKIHI